MSSTEIYPTSSSVRRGGVVRSIWYLAGDRRRILARSAAWKAGQSVALAIPVGVLVALIDRLRSDTLEVSDLWWAVAIIALCAVAQWVCGYQANRSAWIATFELFGEVRIRALDHLRKVPMAFHSRRKSGDTVTALTQDVNMVETFTHEPLQQMIGAAVAPVVVFLVLLTQDVPLALATMMSVAVAVPVFWWTNRVFATLARRRQDAQALAASHMVEYIQGLPVIRSFRLTGERLDSFRAALDDYRTINTRLVVKLGPLIGLFSTTLTLGIALVLFVGTLRLTGGVIDAGTFVVFAVLILRVYQPLLLAADSSELLRVADASLDRLAEVLDAPIQPEPTTPGPAPTSFGVTFDAVEFGYDDEPVLRGVTFDAPPGTMTAIVGPSGAGKSTILNLVARFWDVDSGAVRIGGIDVRELTAEQLFDAVTFVFQDTYLFPGTIFDNIAFGSPGAEPSTVEQAARAARAHDFVTALPQGYDTRVGESGATL